jgi:arginine/serine-rich splicing factor 1/9
VRTKDVEDLFYKYGKINFVDLKNRKGPPFAFIEFDDLRDAQDAVKSRDGYNYDGYRLRVEFSKGSRFDGNSDYKSRDSRGGISARRTEYRCLVTGLPPTGSWQDLKDHMREAGNVCYSDVFKDGTGVVEFTKYEDMKYAIRALDDSKFRSHEGETSYIRVRMDSSVDRSRSRSRSRSPSRRTKRSTPSYSPMRRSSDRRQRSSRSRSRTSKSASRSKSPSKSRSHSRSRSLRRSRSKASPSRSRSRSPRNRSKSTD